ncbi:MAG TPA: FKBP-type peptidyl-prolyl cis-trans isomerase [Vicinamibacterales bacterium]|nr:FKBP-type peptidyl-prolyl cis-trans isomerase [Vicinamibacterales bacterium]
MRILSTILFVALLTTTAWAQAPADIPAPADLLGPPSDAVKSATGLISKAIKPGTGADKPIRTDVVSVDYTGWRSDGVMYDSSVVRGKPSTFPLDRVMAGWRECVMLMTVGETRRCWVPQDLAYRGQTGRPLGTVVFDIELLDMRPSPLIPPTDVKAPPEDAHRTPSGLAYKTIRAGTGIRRPSAFSEVSVHYTGWTTEGKMFDSSVTRGQPINMRLDGVIKGWTEGVPLMVEGERTRFWIPENLAYEGKGEGPRGMLVFDIELVKIQ